MYDATNEPHEFVADGRAQALAKACEFFGKAEDELLVNEPAPGAVYGLGGRAVIVAWPRDRKPPERDRGGDRGDRGERGGGRGRRDNGRGRDRGGRGGDRGGRGRGDRGGRSERPAQAETSELPEPSGPSVGTARGELGEVGQFVLGIIERMDVGPFEIGESGEEGLLVVQVSGPAAPYVAGSDGRTGDALQLIVNQAAARVDEDAPRVVLDLEADPDAREARLSKLAQRVAQRARETGNAVRLDPMNGKDRRLIHLALRDEDDVATMSTGEGRYRQVLVVPEGAPEFEEATRESEAASQRPS